MRAANVVSALTVTQAEDLRHIEEIARKDKAKAQEMFTALLKRTFNVNARHSMRCIMSAHGLQETPHVKS